MTDEAYVFHEDSKEKKRVARSAHKKATHNSRRCRFPSDYKTRKELNAMNSEVTTYNLAAPMKWAEYKKMPAEIRRKYIVSLEDKYQATVSLPSALLALKYSTVVCCSSCAVMVAMLTTS